MHALFEGWAIVRSENYWDNYLFSDLFTGWWKKLAEVATEQDLYNLFWIKSDEGADIFTVSYFFLLSGLAVYKETYFYIF